jgi:3-phenylpropionate/trans-cinnamate dioxygenase ferredoxin subunit
MTEKNWIRVADAEECAPGTLLGVEAGGKKVVLANVDGTLYGLEDRCSHAEYPLSTGELSGDRLQCAYHGAKFEVRSGRAVQMPAIRPVRSYDVEVRDGGIFVALD